MTTSAPFISKEDVTALRDYVMGPSGQVRTLVRVWRLLCGPCGFAEPQLLNSRRAAAGADRGADRGGRRPFAAAAPSSCVRAETLLAALSVELGVGLP